MIQRYKLHLPPNFHCGLVFFELRQQDATSESALARFVDGLTIRGFAGGLILRGDGMAAGASGEIKLTKSVTPMESSLATGGSLLGRGVSFSKSVQVAEANHVGAMLTWAEFFFSRFAFDLVAQLQGTYDPQRLSSFYGVGGSIQSKPKS